MIYGELNVVLTDLSLGSAIELGGNILYGELSATLADSSLGSTVELSGNILYSVLGDASITSNGVVLVLGGSTAVLDDITPTATGLIPSNGSLLSTLEDVISCNFGTIYNGTLAPYEDVISWTGHPLTGSLVRVRTGNLVGIFGQPNEFGLFAGEGWDASSGAAPLASSKYVRLGSFTNEFHNVPIKLYDTGVLTMQMEPDAPSFAMGNPLPSAYGTGLGLWQGKDSDDVYKWRVGDPSVGGSMLSWNGSSLSLVNSSLDISGATSHLAFGNPPPTSPTSGTGIWIDRTGLYGVNDGVTQIFIDTLDGVLYVDGGTEFGVNPLLGDLYVDGILTIGTDGRLQQGTGTWGVDFTGSAIWNDSGVMNIGGWNDNVKQWWGGSDGKFFANEGNMSVDKNGLTLSLGNVNDASKGIIWFTDDVEQAKSMSGLSELQGTVLSSYNHTVLGQNHIKAELRTNNPVLPGIATTQIIATTGTYSGAWVSCVSDKIAGDDYVSVGPNFTSSCSRFNIFSDTIKLDTMGSPNLAIQISGNVLATGLFSVMGGLNVGGTSDPGTGNLVVDGNVKVTDYITADGGIHVGGTSDPGTGNLVVDGNVKVTDYITADGGIHVGGTSDPGTGNLVVDGTIKDGSGVEYLKTTGKAADSDKLDGIDSTDFVQTSGNQTIAGVKTFSSLPTLPTTTPTTNQPVRKAYADANYLGINAKAADSNKLDGLDSTAFGQPVFLTTPLTSTSWNGDSFSTTGKTLIDLSAVFGVPAGVKAVLVKASVRDSASASGSYNFQLSGISSGTNYSLTVQASPINDRLGYGNAIVPCDANGDVYYQITASGTNTMDVWFEIWGYWL